MKVKCTVGEEGRGCTYCGSSEHEVKVCEKYRAEKEAQIRQRQSQQYLVVGETYASRTQEKRMEKEKD